MPGFIVKATSPNYNTKKGMFKLNIVLVKKIL